MRDVVPSIELGKSHGPYPLHQAQEVSSLPHPSHAAVAAHLAAPLTAADSGDSVSTVSAISGVAAGCGVAGVFGVPGVSGVPAAAAHPKQGIPPGTLNWGTSTVLEVALQVMVLCR